MHEAVEDGIGEGRVVMLAMHKDGVIALPLPKGPKHRPRPIAFGPETEPPLFPAPTTLDEVRPLQMRTVVRETREGRLWNEFVARYHYLGYKTLVGAQMRNTIHDRNGWPLAMLGFSTAAWMGLTRFGGRLRAVATSTGVGENLWKGISLGDRC